MNIPTIHLYVFTEKNLLSMFLDKKPNYGKEIVKNNLVLSEGRAYYKIVSKAIIMDSLVEICLERASALSAQTIHQ